MHRRFFQTLALISLLAPIVPAAQAMELTVSAATSLKEPLEEIRPLFEAARPGATVVYYFGSSGSLQNQIQQGAPVDVFVSAGTMPVNALAEAGLVVPGSLHVVAANKVVLIAPRDSKRPTNFEDLADPAIRVIAVGEPKTVPAGQFAGEVFQALKIRDAIQSRLVFAKDVRQVLVYVETGNADAGVVYASDAAQSDRVRVVAGAPPGSHARVTYPAVVLRRSASPALAGEFIAFLEQKTARDVFLKRGFDAP